MTRQDPTFDVTNAQTPFTGTGNAGLVPTDGQHASCDMSQAPDKAISSDFSTANHLTPSPMLRTPRSPPAIAARKSRTKDQQGGCALNASNNVIVVVLAITL